MKFMRVHFGAILAHKETAQEWYMIHYWGKKKRRIPVTIAEKVSLSRTNRKMHKKYINWLGIRKFRKQFLKIPEAIPKGEEKAYKFKEQQAAAAEQRQH